MNFTQTVISVLLVIGVLTVCGEKAERRKRPRGWRRSSHDPLERSSRGLVPQLMANYSGPEVTPAHLVSCSQASLECAQRDGCGSALSQYLVTCSDLVTSVSPSKCSRQCQLSLIALLSTEEGARLMECQCEDERCRQQRQRVEPCRSEVTWNTRPDTIVTCTAATWICGADAVCGTALQYYNANCKKMFRGEKCSKRCKNSLDILLRQKAAAKLSTCYCEGTEDFDCITIRRNTDVLCFGKKPDTDFEDNEIDVEEKPLKTNGSWRNKGSALIILSFLTTFAMAEMGSSVSAGVLYLSRALS